MMVFRPPGLAVEAGLGGNCAHYGVSQCHGYAGAISLNPSRSPSNGFKRLSRAIGE